MKHITTMPSKAVVLPDWPEDHDCDFIQENLPDNLVDAISLIVKHVKAIFG